MILVDTGPIVALFDRRDDAHEAASARLEKTRGPLTTTVPVLTKRFICSGRTAVARSHCALSSRGEASRLPG